MRRLLLTLIFNVKALSCIWRSVWISVSIFFNSASDWGFWVSRMRFIIEALSKASSICRHLCVLTFLSRRLFEYPQMSDGFMFSFLRNLIQKRVPHLDKSHRLLNQVLALLATLPTLSACTEFSATTNYPRRYGALLC